MSKEIKNIEEEIIIYQADDKSPQIDVHFNGETLWLSQQKIADLFQTSRTNVVEHIDHIYSEDELDKEATCRNFRQVRRHEDMNLLRGLGWCGKKTSFLPNFPNKTTSVAKEYNIYLQPHYLIKTSKI
jgi:hypothetical protein